MMKNLKKKVLSVCLAFVITVSACLVHVSAYATDANAVSNSSAEETENASSKINIARNDLKNVYCAERDLEMEGYGYTLDTLTDGDSGVNALFYASCGYATAENTVSITMEFNSTYEIDNVTLTPRYLEDGTTNGFPEDFTISVKTSRGWQNVVQETGYAATLDKQIFDFPSVKGSAVKLTATKLTADGQWYSLYMREMEVWGYQTSEFDLNNENLAYTKQPTIVSPEADPWGEGYEESPGVKPYCKESLLDGEVNTYYISTEVNSADSTVDITMTFDDFYEIDNVTFLPHYVSDASLFFPEDFTVSVKTRNGGWQTVVNANGYVASKGIIANEDGTFEFDNGKQSFDFDAIITDTIKFTATKLTCNTEGVYALYLPEMEVYGQSTEYTTYSDNIALGATVSADLADESMFEYGFTPDKLIDDVYIDDVASYVSVMNSKAEDYIDIQLDFNGWYKMNNVSLKPHIQEEILYHFPEDFEISVKTETGWQSVLKRTGYTVAVCDMQSFDFEEISGNALKLTVTKLTEHPENVGVYALYLTELQVYGVKTEAPIADDKYMNVALTEGVEITATSQNPFMEENGFTIDKLIDNQYDSYEALGYFSSDEFLSADGPVEIELDLKKYYEIQQINLFPFWTDNTCSTIKDFPIDFSFSVRTPDGWIPVKSVEGYSALNGENAFSFDAIVGDGVKLTVTKLALDSEEYGTYCMALSEIQVLGTEAGTSHITLPDDISNIAVSQHCVAGAVTGIDIDSDYINDGDTSNLYTGTTYTSAEVESGEYILLNLDKPQVLSQVKFYTNYQDSKNYGFPKAFKIRTYCDGEWMDVVEESEFEADGETITFTFPQVNAERVELVATVLTETETAGTYALQVKEIEVYGKATATAGTADLNLDYEVNEVDLDIMRGNLLKTQYSVLKSADCNSDDSVDVRDLVSLKRQSAQNVSTQNLTSGITYYVDSSVLFGGDGLSPDTPLRTLDAVNALKLSPGDSVLFKRGGIWTGQLCIAASGTEEAPITFGSYGSGDLPIIQGEGQYSSVIYGENVSYITVKELEVTNSGDTTDYHRGIYFCAKSRSSYGISIIDCYVHDIDSNVSEMSVVVEQAGLSDIHWLGGIVVRARSEEFEFNASSMADVTVNDILIQNNRVENCMRTGIVAGGSTVSSGKKSTDICIRGNQVVECYGDGIILFNDHAGMMEGNLSSGNAQGATGYDDTYAYAGIWNVECSGDVMQYNESCDTKLNRDGQGFDIDGGCSGTLVQYNYSHDNAGGAFLLMQNRSGSVTIRHNISQNDKGYIIGVSVASTEANAEPFLNVDIYNNILYATNCNHENCPYKNDTYTSCPFIIGFSSDGKELNTGNIGTLAKNVFYLDTEVYVREYTIKDYLTISNNIYYNYTWNQYTHATGMDSSPSFNNPLFINAGTGGDGLLSLEGYVLQSDSPCIDMGFTLPIE